MRKNSVDPDQTAPDESLHCFPILSASHVIKANLYML